MSRKRKLFVTIAVVGIIGTVAMLGTFAAFTATTSNSNNKIESGTVKVDQHSGAATLYSVTNQKPTDATSKCVRVSYSGSLAASMKLYISSGAVTNGTLYNLKVERGSGLTTLDSSMSCAGFTASSTAYDGALGSFGTNYAGGSDGKAAAAAWAQNDTVDYRFTITQNDDATANAHTTVTSSGLHTFTWEARNN